MSRLANIALLPLFCIACSPFSEGARIHYVGPGPEDLAAVALDDGCQLVLTATAPRGGIGGLLASFSADKHKLRQLSPTGEVEDLLLPEEIKLYKPLALSVVVPTDVISTDADSNPPVKLFVLDHQREGLSAEEQGRILCLQLKVEGCKATVAAGCDGLPQSVAVPRSAGSANSIAATRTGQIYLSTFKLSLWGSDETPRQPESLSAESTPLKGDAIYLYSPHADRWTLAAEGISGANGLALSQDERYLFVSAYHAGKVWRFARDPDSGALSDPQAILNLPELGLPGHPDNLTLDADGRLYVAAQTSKMATLLYLLVHPSIPSHAQIYRLDDPRLDAPQVACFKVPERFHGASTALALKSPAEPGQTRLILGQIVGDKLLELQVNDSDWIPPKKEQCR